MEEFLFSFFTRQTHYRDCRVKPYLFFELHCSYCFDPNTYEFKEELIDWDYKGFRLRVDKLGYSFESISLSSI